MDDKSKRLLNENREKIDKIDRQIVELFENRMNIAKEIGDIKLENNLAILDEARENSLVMKAMELAKDEGLRSEIALLMRSIIALGRAYQRKHLFRTEELLIPKSSTLKKEDVRVAYQGVPGAWSEQATIKLFKNAERIPLPHFEDVFSAVKRGTLDYGVIPMENSQSGAIGETYDLLKKYGCYIVGKTWIDVKQCLLAKPNTGIKDIREVYSHPEGFKQCHRFLSDKSWDFIATANTARSAQMVSEDSDIHKAAIGSRLAAELNGLEVIATDIMDSDTNQTSFAIIAPAPIYTQNSERISATFSLPHRSGALCEALLPFNASSINMNKLESRPAMAQGEYRFFIEIEGNIMDSKIVDMLKQVQAACLYFEVNGCYSLID